jgi:hypothetical protein
MSETDPVDLAIQRHRAADAAWAANVDDDLLHKAEGEAMVALLRTQPITLAGCAALLRYVGEIAQGDRDAAMFNHWIEPWKSAGAAFPAMIAEAIEQQS